MIHFAQFYVNKCLSNISKRWRTAKKKVLLVKISLTRMGWSGPGIYDHTQKTRSSKMHLQKRACKKCARQKRARQKCALKKRALKK